MNWDNVCVWVSVSVLLFILVRFIMFRPIEKRYEAALDDLLSKEIARSFYKELHLTLVTLVEAYEKKYYKIDTSVTRNEYGTV